MRVVIDALSARQGGGQTYLLNLLAHLPADLPLKVFVLASSLLTVEQSDSRITRLQVSWPTENPFLRAVWQRVALPRLLAHLKADILFCPGGVVGTRPAAPCRTVTMFRNMIPFDIAQRKRYPLGYMRARNWLLRRVMLRSMVQADLVIFVSKYARDVIERAAGKPLVRSVVIPHGVADWFKASYAMQLPRPDWLPDGPYVLYVSTLDFYKAQIEVVRGYHLLSQQRPTHERLILAGPENPTYGNLVRQEIGRLGLNDRVMLTGKLSYRELPPLYQNAKLIIFASESENCPNILLESLASARPILCSNRAPMPEFGGEAVRYFDPSSPEDLAAKLRSVLDDVRELQRLAMCAAEASKRYDWRIAGDRTWRALQATVVS